MEMTPLECGGLTPLSFSCCLFSFFFFLSFRRVWGKGWVPARRETSVVARKEGKERKESGVKPPHSKE
jgi:hypothetical protein